MGRGEMKDFLSWQFPSFVHSETRAIARNEIALVASKFFDFLFCQSHY